MNRQSRERRRRGIQVRLTERDALLLEALVRFRLARTSDLARIAFPDVRPTTAGLRLRRLFDAGYVEVRSGDRSEENVYALGPNGHRWADEQGLPVGRVPRGGTAHHLAIVRAWSSVAAELTREPDGALDLARADWDLREEFGARGVAIVPDLLLVLRVRERTIVLAVEVDLGTESLGVLRQKVMAYAELAGRRSGLFGYRDFALAVALGTPGRLVGVRQVLARRWAGRSLVWVLASGPAESLGGLLTELRDGGGGTATDPDYGNGGSSAVSGSEFTRKQSGEEGL